MIKSGIYILAIAMSGLLIISCGPTLKEDPDSITDDDNVTHAEAIKQDKLDDTVSRPDDIDDIKPEHLTAKSFKEKVWNYEKYPEEWIYQGEEPCIIDFYADWCKPCKLVAPIMDKLADEYDGRLKVYKIDTEKQRELAAVFRVRSIPTILFAPLEGEPAMQPGALSEEQYKNIIEEFIFGNKKENK